MCVQETLTIKLCNEKCFFLNKTLKYFINIVDIYSKLILLHFLSLWTFLIHRDKIENIRTIIC